MMIQETICESCTRCQSIPAKTNAPPEDCYPAEVWCEEESDNFWTPDGCYHYTERYDDY